VAKSEKEKIQSEKKACFSLYISKKRFAMKTLDNFKNIFSVLLAIFSFAIYPQMYGKLSAQANSLVVLPLIAIALLQGMKIGEIFSISISVKSIILSIKTIF
jgi:hypothetical protein